LRSTVGTLQQTVGIGGLLTLGLASLWPAAGSVTELAGSGAEFEASARSKPFRHRPATAPADFHFATITFACMNG
jgi:hypothetical protein